jgi:hypothetical protein
MSIRALAVLWVTCGCAQALLGQAESDNAPIQNMTFAETAALFGDQETATSPPPANAEPTGDRCNRDPLWVADADAVFLQRSAPRSQQVLSGLNADQLKCPVAAGCAFDLIRQHVACTGWSLEGAYLGVDGFRSQEAGLVPSAGISSYSGDYQSALRSAEFNVRRDWTDWLTILAGIRYIGLTENLAAHGILEGPTLTNFVLLESLDNSTSNQMVGFQLGADICVVETGRLTVDFTSKAGIYANRATYASSVYNTYYNNASANQAAFEGELKLAAQYSLTQALSFNIGYQLMWLSGVALAADQTAVELPSLARVDSSGTVFYNGAFVGLEYCR